MLELRSFSHKIKSIEEAESTKAECFEITEKLIKYRKDADLKNKKWRFLHSHHLKVSQGQFRELSSEDFLVLKTGNVTGQNVCSTVQSR